MYLLAAGIAADVEIVAAIAVVGAADSVVVVGAAAAHPPKNARWHLLGDRGLRRIQPQKRRQKRPNVLRRHTA